MTQICMSVKSSQNKLLGKIFSDEIIKLMKLDNKTPMTNKRKLHSTEHCPLIINQPGLRSDSWINYSS